MFLEKLSLEQKRVFLRADLNIPTENKQILEDHRLYAILPTIDYIKSHGGKIILATHIGRPNHAYDENLSTRILVDWFKNHGYAIDYEIDLLKAIKKSKFDFDTILLIENLRFFAGEKEVNLEFAELLAQCSDVYVNDAFGTIHRTDTSVTLLPEQFSPENRAFGLLVEKELAMLRKLKGNTERPFVIVIGGSKAETKIKMLEQFLIAKVDTILIGGAIAAQIGEGFLETAKHHNVTVLLPNDVCTVQQIGDDVSVYDIGDIPNGNIIVDIGPKTTETFISKIKQAKTIFANGPMGIYEQPAYGTGSKKILEAIAAAPAYSIIGGGDAVAATTTYGLAEKMDFLSTGGGATLAYLSCANPEEELPGLKIMHILSCKP